MSPGKPAHTGGPSDGCVGALRVVCVSVCVCGSPQLPWSLPGIMQRLLFLSKPPGGETALCTRVWFVLKHKTCSQGACATDSQYFMLGVRDNT